MTGLHPESHRVRKEPAEKWRKSNNDTQPFFFRCIQDKAGCKNLLLVNRMIEFVDLLHLLHF